MVQTSPATRHLFLVVQLGIHSYSQSHPHPSSSHWRLLITFQMPQFEPIADYQDLCGEDPLRVSKAKLGIIVTLSRLIFPGSAHFLHRR
jgi:hypothetical protein